MKFKASEIAELVCGEVEGNNDVIIHDFSKIEQGREGTLTFLANPRYCLLYTSPSPRDDR